MSDDELNGDELDGGVPDRDRYLDDWSRLHGGIDPRESFWIAGWLRLVHRIAHPLAVRRASPDVVTATGLLIGIAVVASAAAGGRWPLVGAVLVVASGVVDGVDGAVAVMRHVVSPRGAVLDTLVDRLTDLMFLGALWVLGAPGELCAAAAALTLLLESTRMSASLVAMPGPAVITVWERPSRIIVVVISLLAAGVVPARHELSAVVGTSVALVLASIAFAQLLAAIRRRLR